MKVTYIGRNDLKVSENPAKPSRQTRKESAETGGIRKDRIRLSKDVQDLLEIEKRLKGSEGVEARAEIVERLRRQIKEGVYKPDSWKVADKMIAESRKDLRED